MLILSLLPGVSPSFCVNPSHSHSKAVPACALEVLNSALCGSQVQTGILYRLSFLNANVHLWHGLNVETDIYSLECVFPNV